MNSRLALLALTGLAAAAAGVLALLDNATRERIQENEARKLLATLALVLPAGAYDNEPHRDRVLIGAPLGLGSLEPVPVYRARQQTTPVALVLSPVATDGYVDAIRLLVSVNPAGKIYGVRVTEHLETPGLGDGIDTAVSDWILGFDGLSTDSPDAAWMLSRDGGEFDQLTGATVTSRAVLNAVRRALRFAEAHGTALFSLPVDSEEVMHGD